MTDEQLEIVKLQVTGWAKVVDVQQHFNDIEMRIRALLLTLIGVLLGIATGFAEHGAIQQIQVLPNVITSYTMTAALAVCFVLTLLFCYMDAFWYHVYLRGAVANGELLENIISKSVPGIRLTQAISRMSYRRQLWRRRSTGNRLALFYGAIAYLLAAATIATRTQDRCVLTVLVTLAILLLLAWLLWPHTARTQIGSPTD